MKDKNKLLKILLIILVVMFVAHQLYASLYSPIATESAEYMETVDGIAVTGIMIRNEVPIEGDPSGVMHFNIDDGERIAKNGAIADVYRNASDSIAVSRINELNKQIDSIEKIEGYNASSVIDLSLLGSKISGGVYNIVSDTARGDFGDVADVKNELLTNLNRRQMITGGTYDFSAQLTALKSERDTLSAGLSSPYSSVRATVSGFFVSATDGYENVLTADDLTKYTPEFMSSVTAESKTAAVGKIVSDYVWYIAAEMSLDDSLFYKVGDKAKIKTSLKNNPELAVAVELINTSPELGRAVVIFSCCEMNCELASMRDCAMTVVKGEYKGLKVSKKALHSPEGKNGVYVSTGTELKFVSTKVLYSNDDLDYVICEKASNTDSDGLRLYDKVVIRGKNLYDGKLITG